MLLLALYSTIWFQVSLAQWAWLGGNNTVLGVYGTKGVPSSVNQPPPTLFMRHAQVNDSIYVYGGSADGILYDNLWRYNLTSRQWTWIYGAAAQYNFLPPQFGTNNTFGAIVTPGTRILYAIFHDSDSLYIFGGATSRSPGFADNNLFEFSLSLLQWRFLSGSADGRSGVFGELGKEAPDNFPPARLDFQYFYDIDLRLLFIHGGAESFFASTYRADWWTYNLTSGQWAWLGGSVTLNAPPVYGRMGVGTSATNPGQRSVAGFSYDTTSKRFYIFGGFEPAPGTKMTNDLWMYDIGSNIWTWIAGSFTAGSPGVYEVTGVPSLTALPRARGGANMAYNPLNNSLLINGGWNQRSGVYQVMNDMWEYSISDQTWTWLTGNRVLNIPPLYGSINQYSGAVYPGGRVYPVSFFYETQFYLFSGSSVRGLMNDMWTWRYYAVPRLVDTYEESSGINVTTSETLRQPNRRPIAPNQAQGSTVNFYVVLISLGSSIAIFLFFLAIYLTYRKRKNDVNAALVPTPNIMNFNSVNQQQSSFSEFPPQSTYNASYYNQSNKSQF